ncbi:MAG: glycoside hydrolase family 5 protein [Ruminococcus sp.]|nr:glycoside hydrolase family 5 protein [Ruminococcus sp.]
MRISKVLAGVFAAVMTLGCLASCGSGSSSSDNGASSAAEGSQAQEGSEAPSGEDTPQEMNKTMTALELSKLMGNGINLGNTMEAYGHKSYVKGETDPRDCEHNWGQPTTTKEMIEGMKAAGFDSLRIPVAWTNAMAFETGDYTIDSLYLDRVGEIIDYAMDCGMYVIVNDHWDGGWWGMFGSATEETRNKAMDMYTSMWQQICERYKNYDEHLIFESANEELGDRLNDKDLCSDSGSLNKDQCFEKLLEINQRFVDTVRASGGNNADRFLLIAGYNTDFENTCDARYKMPTDTVENRMLVSVHYYTPWNYCGEKALQSWGSPIDVEQMNKLMKDMSKFTKAGYGVIIGEYGVLMNGGQLKPDADKYYTNFLNNCDLYNYVPMLWDCNNLYNKAKKEIIDETIAKMYKERSYSAQSSLTDEEIQKNASEAIEQFYQDAVAAQQEDIGIPPADDKAIAWIMYNSADYNVSYCVGDTYDPSSMTAGIVAQNVIIEGDGTYEVSLDFTKAGGAHGVAFSALGVSNGEKLFPGCVIKIEEIKVNGEAVQMTAPGYTSSDAKDCTRVNLFNEWVKSPPKDARSIDGDVSNASAQIINKDDFKTVNTLEIKFTFKTAA